MESLPAEIRLKIFQYLVPKRNTYYIGASSTIARSGHSSIKLDDKDSSCPIYSLIAASEFCLDLLTLCKTISNDCLVLLYGGNQFLLSSRVNVFAFIELIGKHNALRVKHIALSSYLLPDYNTTKWVSVWERFFDEVNFPDLFNSLESLHIRGVGRGTWCTSNDPPRTVFNAEKWDMKHYYMVKLILRSLGVTNDGAVYCGTLSRSTTICLSRCTYPDKTNDKKIDMGDIEKDDKIWVEDEEKR